MCEHTVCRENAFEDAGENFAADKGFSLYDLKFTYDAAQEAEKVEWDTITRETDFNAAYRYLWTVADMYLAEGTSACIRY